MPESIADDQSGAGEFDMMALVRNPTILDVLFQDYIDRSGGLLWKACFDFLPRDTLELSHSEYESLAALLVLGQFLLLIDR